MNKPDLKDGKPWSDADDDVLRASVAGGTGLIEAAAVLCRSGTPREAWLVARGWEAPSQRGEPSPAASADRENTSETF
jgi:hypothetical protein